MVKIVQSFLHRPYRWAGLYAGLLAAFFGFTLLDAFFIPKSYAMVIEVTALPTASAAEADEPAATATAPQVTDSSYQDENIRIEITTLRAYDTTVYVADVQISEASLLRTALAGNLYGRNIKDTTSAMAAEQGALLAINGDYYGFRDTGYVVRNGVLYRDSFSGDSLLIDENGDLSILHEAADLEALMAEGAQQIFSFGPALVEEGQIAVDSGDEVSQSMRSNPRTAIGQVGPLHYILIVSEGRTADSQGLSLLELAEQLTAFGCQTAYNLDGGGSSTLVFMDQVVNQTVGGRKNSEREVSDIVYIGYP